MRKLEKRISTALQKIDLPWTVWAYGGVGHPAGFAIVSSLQEIDEHGICEDKPPSTQRNLRQFIFVLSPTVVETNDRPAEEEEFTYYFEHGSAELPDSIADNSLVDTREGGDHLYLLVYRFQRPMDLPTLDLMSDNPEIDHFHKSGLAAALDEELGK